MDFTGIIMDKRLVHLDGKHWIGKKRPNESLQIHSYEHVVKQASKNLGFNGIVAIPNARPDERRYEEFIESGRKEGKRLRESDERGGAFYDSENEIYFIKAQEVRTQIDEVPIVLLAYNLPFGKNLSDKDGNQTLEEAAKYNCILGINLPSCIDNVDKSWLNLFSKIGHFDFVVGYSGGAALKGFGSANFSSQNFYGTEIKRKGFENPFTKEKHNIGIIAVSGGHRTPEGKLEEFLNGGQTLGSSYTEIPEPNPNNFMNDLRKSLRDSTEGNMNSEPTIIEAIKSQLSIKISDRLKNLILG